MKYLIYLDCLERTQFFLRIANSLDGEIIFFTNRLSIAFVLRNFKVKIIKNKKFETRLSDEELAKTLSVAGSYQTLSQAREVSCSVFANISEIYEKEKFDRMLIWNGSTTIAKSLAKFANSKSIKVTFFELSNLPGKLFWDHLGVNAASSLFGNPEILDSYDVDKKTWQAWLDFYKLQASSVKQSANKRKVRYIQVLDYLGFLIGFAKEDFRNPFQVVAKKFRNKFSKIYPKIDLDCDFVFIPLQVSSDTQIILNSDFDNFDAIKFAKNKYPIAKIFIKIHPAEENLEFITQIEGLSSQLDIEICSNDTKELIQKAKHIVVINSTVGLESMILGKEIDILGRAVYSKFDKIRLKNYICAYLANIEYFSDEYVERIELTRILG